MVLLYVDDMIIMGNNEVAISMITNDLLVRFEMKNLEEVSCFLGLEIEKTDQGYFVSQKICEETVNSVLVWGSRKKRQLQWNHISS